VAGEDEVEAPTPEEVSKVQILLACPDCGWSGTVRLYDIGDGPEWCCPSCDMCFPSNPVRGEDGLTKAERALHHLAAQLQAQRSSSREFVADEVRRELGLDQ
jgi:hypothetical protein